MNPAGIGIDDILATIRLTRPDLVRLLGEWDDAEAALAAWCLGAGASDYRAIAEFPDARRAARLDEPMPGFETARPFAITRAMYALWRARSDLQRAFDLRDPAGQEAFVWWYLRRPAEETGAAAPTETQRAAVMAPSPEVVQDAGFPITVAMHRLWRDREDLRATFDLATPAGRERFVLWHILYGVGDPACFAPLDEARRAALVAPAPGMPATSEGPVTRLMALLRGVRPDLQGAFDLRTDEGRRGLVRWYREVAVKEMPLAWTLAKPGFDPAAPAIVAPPAKRDGASLVGYARGVLGIGEDLRMMSRALTSAEVGHSIFEIAPSAATANTDLSVAHLVRERIEYETKLFVLTAMETARIHAVHGLAPFAGGRSVGCWPWEFERMPPEWAFAGKFVDEIWASSAFTARAFESDCGRPVSTLPMAVELPPWQRRSRRSFALPERRFLFLSAFDVQSGMARKNPWGAIEAFRAAFPHERGVGLVVKLSNAPSGHPGVRRLKRLAAEDGRIRILDRTLAKADWLALIAAADCFVSLHRSEGFGRILAEALLLERPVIATDFSGSTDFLSEATGYPVAWRPRRVRKGEYPFAAGLTWAEPDIADAARRMIEAVEDRGGAAERAAAGRALIERRHAPAAVGAACRARLIALGAFDG